MHRGAAGIVGRMEAVTLTTPRLVLAPPVEADVDAITEAARIPEVPR